MIERYDSDHPRDTSGRWTSGGQVSVEEWSNVARHYQKRADARRIQEANHAADRKGLRRGALWGVVGGLVFTAFGLLANYATGGTPLW